MWLTCSLWPGQVIPEHRRPPASIQQVDGIHGLQMKVRLCGVTRVATCSERLPSFDAFSDASINRLLTKMCQQDVGSRVCQLQDHVVA
jgi:hypothetical protein